MPIPERFVAFIYGDRVEKIAPVLAKAFPGEWGVRILPAAARKSKSPQTLIADDAVIKAALRPPKGDSRLGVLFAIDQRPDAVNDLRERFRYDFPVVEVRTAKERGDIVRALRPELEYFAIIPSDAPGALRDALEAFHARHPDVQVLPRAWKSVDEAADFKEPRLVMGALHLLYWVTVAWAEAKRMDHDRSRNSPELRLSTYDAMHQLMRRTEFNVSDSAKEISWVCGESTYRDFGWHLKIDLPGDFSTETYCRVYFHVQKVGVERPVLWIGHCGEHQ